MKHSFSDAPTIEAPRSRFDRSHGHKFTMDAGWLVPYYWDMVLPGDTFNMNSTIFARMATPAFPVMDNMRCQTQFFFVPTRLIWDNFRKFCGEQVNPTDSIDFSIPILQGTTLSDADGDLTTAQGQTETLINYLGVPQDIAPNDVDISALPTRAYQLIYNEWYRDQNLINSALVDTDDGPDNIGTTDYRLRRRGKRHDYFTSALPWPQKGDAVTLPLGTRANIAVDGSSTDNTYVEDGQGLRTFPYHALDANQVLTRVSLTGSATEPVGQMYANLTTATSATINDLREAFQVQKLLERDARAGTRYSELVANHFGVNFYDISYRPEYLGGSSDNVSINPVPATASSAGNGLGQVGSFATSGGSGHGFTKSFVEHGIVMGIVSVIADLTYQQGLNRHFSHSTRYDYYWPSLAHLGEQEILNKEIYCDGTANDDLVFGYQERYAEYRYKPSQISGKFLSKTTASLDAWHLSQEFASLPTLGQTFIEENPPIDRVISVPTQPHFIVDTYQKLICARPMPVFGVPGMIDHFQEIIMGGIISAIGGGILEKGLDIGFDWWSTKKANELVRDSWDVNSAEALKQRQWATAEAQAQRGFGAGQAEILRDYQTSEREAKQSFDERMSSSAVQRRMTDLSKAGINPILAGKYDASTPSAQAMSGGMASAGITSGASATAGASAKKMESTRIADSLADIRLKQKQGDLVDAQAKKVTNETKYVGQKSDVIGPMAEFMAGMLELSKKLGANRSSAGQIVEQNKEAWQKRKEAQKIRSQPGIEVTPHVKRKGKKKTSRGSR